LSINTYAELQTAVASWVHRADLTTPIPDLIMLGERWIWRHARVRDMEAALSLTIASGVATIPTDYRSLKHARIDGTPTRHLRMRAASWIMENYPLRSSGGKPFFIAADGASFIFGPFPDSNYSVLGTYYKELTTIATSANAVFTANPDLYLFAALAETRAFIQDDKRIPIWTAKRDAILADMNGEAKDSEQGVAMEVTPG